MRRREFITSFGGLAASWPLAGLAQQRERMRRIGVLTSSGGIDADAQARHAAFVEGLGKLGWTDGGNVRIDARWAAGDAAEIRKHAAELVALSPDAIMVTGSAAVGPLLELTRTVPIVF